MGTGIKTDLLFAGILHRPILHLCDLSFHWYRHWTFTSLQLTLKGLTCSQVPLQDNSMSGPLDNYLSVIRSGSYFAWHTEL